MKFRPTAQIDLDYGTVASQPKLLENISGVAADGRFLWTVSDEGRTLEWLEAGGSGYVLRQQVDLDDPMLQLALPRLDPRGGLFELDLEAAAFTGSHLFVAGSHCRVREQPPGQDDGFVRPRIVDRTARNCLVRLKIEDGKIARARMLPVDGAQSLRGALAADRFLRPFLELPAKENGLDIEGLCALDKDHIVLGLRGPVLDSNAVAIEIRFGNGFEIANYTLRFLALDGLAIRDLTVWDNDILVLAGPVTDARVPFALYRWSHAAAVQPGQIEKPVRVLDFDQTGEKPEGICRLVRGGVAGLLVIYDRPDQTRIDGTRYTADWGLIPD